MRTPWIKNNLPLFDATIHATSANSYEVFRSGKDGIDQYKGIFYISTFLFYWL